MLANVWSVEEFKKQSNKIFARRSTQLQAIDAALARAHTAPLSSEAGTNAMMELLKAIADWRKSKTLQGKTSGRAWAVDQLQSQLCSAAETIYKRKIGEQKAVDAQVASARAGVVQDLKNVGLMRGQVKMPSSPQPSGTIPRRLPPPAILRPLPHGIPERNAAQDRLFDFLAQAMIDQRRKAMAFDDEDLFDDLDAKQKGRLTARWVLSVPDEVKDVAAARAEALRVLAAMLGNEVGVIKNLLSSNLEVVVIPRDQGMTVLEQFQSIRGRTTFDGRSWDTVRGVGNVTDQTLSAQLKVAHEVRDSKGKGPGAIVAIDPHKGKVYTAITEENLLGGVTTAPGGGCYAPGYSTTTHEFAHSVHGYGLTDADRQTIEKAYQMRLRQSETEMWVDGPRKVGNQSCYASSNAYEYFAQLSNAWLGVNEGTDPYTHRPRNNGKAWVLSHEPKMVSDILERVYGRQSLQDLNPSVILRS